MHAHTYFKYLYGLRQIMCWCVCVCVWVCVCVCVCECVSVHVIALCKGMHVCISAWRWWPPMAQSALWWQAYRPIELWAWLRDTCCPNTMLLFWFSESLDGRVTISQKKQCGTKSILVLPITNEYVVLTTNILKKNIDIIYMLCYPTLDDAPASSSWQCLLDNG